MIIFLMILWLGQGFTIPDVDPFPVLSPLIAVEDHQVLPVSKFCPIEDPDLAVTLGSTLGIFLNKLKFNQGFPSALSISNMNVVCSTCRHITEEEIAPFVLHEEEKSEDQEKISHTDKQDNQHPSVNED